VFSSFQVTGSFLIKKCENSFQGQRSRSKSYGRKRRFVLTVGSGVQGAIVGNVVAMALNLWIMIGNFLVSPHKEWLPTNNATCNASSGAILNSTSLDDVTATMTSLHHVVTGSSADELDVTSTQR